MNKSTPQFPTVLPGSFWGITVFFNPAGYMNKLDNYRRFRKSSKKQGLKLLSVELAFDDKPFVLSEDDADILIQLRGDKNNLMWQKEALLNIGLQNLPSDCDKVAWLDGDIIFRNDDWINETSVLLEKYIVVQPFSFAVLLPQGTYDLSDQDIKSLAQGKDNGKKAPGFVYLFLTSSDFKLAVKEAKTGLVFAFRKSFITKHYFYDRLIVGGADSAMARAFLNKFNDNTGLPCLTNQKVSPDYLRWAQAVHKDVQTSVGFLDNSILHLWHGEKEGRLYTLRFELFELFDFEPDQDIRKSRNGLWEWSSDKPKFHQAVKEYFQVRNEEGHSVLMGLLTDMLNQSVSELRFIKSSRAYRLVTVLWKVSDIIFFHPFLQKIAFYIFDKSVSLIKFLKNFTLRADSNDKIL